MNRQKRIYLAIVFAMFFHSTAYGNIDLNAISYIESKHNARAYNRNSGACGQFQITKCVLLEYNKFNNTRYGKQDLFDARINRMIASWYLEKRIPAMMKNLDIPDTTNNRLIAYNAGIGILKRYLQGKRRLKPETRRYILKYSRIAK